MSYLLELHDQILAAEKCIVDAKTVVADKIKDLNELKDKAWFCQHCGKFYPKETVTNSFEEVTNWETVHTDAGYGDDDEIAEVTRNVTYLHCPVCGKKYAKGIGMYLREKNRRTRR